MDGQRDLRERLGRMLDLPEDVVLDVARIVMIGGLQVSIENHRGLIEYSPERVSLAAPQGQIRITGTDLAIHSITAEEIVLGGHITGVLLEAAHA